MGFRKVLIANRGVIACRIIRTLRNMGIGSVAVYSDADRHSLHVEQADEALRIGPPPAVQSYLNMAALIDAARQTGAGAIHPGYGFLSESAGFAEACDAAGITFIGPTPGQMRAFGLKHGARRLADENGVLLLPGTGLLSSVEEALKEAGKIGFPVMLKSAAGGGGIGMQVCLRPEELREAFAAVQRLSQANFGADDVYLEKFVSRARHIEVQIFGDGQGQVITLGERDCSAQRRNQKVIEETPAPGLSDDIRQQLFQASMRLGQAVSYRSAGTIEFIYDTETAAFYFLEVNTRLQVEHGVTEEVTGVDLVEWMVRQAAGEPMLAEPVASGCSIQVRLYAEDPAKNFQPSAGRLSSVNWPTGARVETWIESGAEVTPFYDPMLAKIIVRGVDRPEALRRMRNALAACEIEGVESNLAYLRQVCASDSFAQGGVTTGFLRDFPYTRHAIDVLEPGTQTTVQDYPGRLGYWHAGVPPSGPMDSLAFRLANRLAGNPENAAGLEVAALGPRLRFAGDTTIALTGADFGARLDDEPIERWKAVRVPDGAVLDLSSAQAAGARAYLAVAGGIQVPQYLGSRSTFILGKFGGHAGRVLRSGDVLHIGSNTSPPRAMTAGLIPRYRHDWEIGVLYGPHGAPDFFTDSDIEMFFSTSWKVHYNSDRTGVRLLGPKPHWARKDGGEAGLHPSNIHDNAYAVGTVDFTGDMPVILGPDGPSLGGFVCPATIVAAELWKIGQLQPGDHVRFHPLSQQQAETLEQELETQLQLLDGALPHLPPPRRESPVLRTAPGVVARADGDKYLLIEYGPNCLDLNLRFRVHAVEHQLRRLNLPGIIDITPGVRSLHIHYDRPLRREALLEALETCEAALSDLGEMAVPSRIVHLPLSWNDPATLLAIRKYMQGVRADAPWCPSNIEFIRRINGLDSVDDVHRVVFDASYLVLGLGDVYLGAPVATPLDPRHRLVTTKYNPARTWTPENAVGIGGAYLCVYGMEGPGGYQFVGRTVQMWNTHRVTPEFVAGTPWLLRFFDQIRFYPVSAGELANIRDAFPRGRYPLRIEPCEFRLREYNGFLSSIETDAVEFKTRQQAAFLEERERWSAAGQAEFVEPPPIEESPAPEITLPEGCKRVDSPIAASVWQISVEPGQRVEAGQRLLILEAMKMEIVISAPASGIVQSLQCMQGAVVFPGQQLVTLQEGA